MYLIKDLYPEYINNFYNSIGQRIQLINGQKIWIDTLPTKIYEMQISTWNDLHH